jgi:sialate O-acetylesterase
MRAHPTWFTLRHSAALLTVLLLSPTLLGAELKLPAIFSDHMVLQRDAPISVWGWADAGAEITVGFAGQTKTTRAEPIQIPPATGAAPAKAPPAKTPVLGRWMVKLDPMPAHREPQVMTIASSGGNQKLEIKDVLVGEVWLCSGQSNMEMPVGFMPWSGGCLNFEEEIRNSPNPLLREYTVARKHNVDMTVGEGKWFLADTTTTGNFSATGYFFAREIQKRLNVPVAIINASVGATPIEAWISREKLLSDPEIADLAAKQAEDATVGAARRKEQYLTEHAAWRKKYDRADPGAPGDGNALAAIATDTSDWKPVSLPGTIGKVAARNGGIVWLRREVEFLVGQADGLWVTLPIVKDLFALYLNGAKLQTSSMENGYGRLLYAAKVPRELIRPGKNVLAIRLQSFAGNGGLFGPTERFRISKSHVGGNEGIPLSGEWRCKVEMEYAPFPRGADPEPRLAQGIGVHYHYTSGWFDRMIAPLMPYAIKGALWYQGEHNCARALEYRKLLPMMISDWRQRWGIGDFPFYICQLPGNGPRPERPEESGWAELREAQAMALKLPNTGLANLIDTCEDGDLHPRNKQDVARRLSLIAMASAYGDSGTACDGPMYQSMRVQEGKAIIQFKNAGDGLVARKLPATFKVNLQKPELGEKPLVLPSPGSEVQGFAICGADRKWVWADAKIEGSAVRVWSEQVSQPVAVRYGWANHPVCNLYNQAGLPAFPFRTDDVPPVKAEKK